MSKSETAIILLILIGCFYTLDFVKLPEADDSRIDDVLLVVVTWVVKGVYDKAKS